MWGNAHKRVTCYIVTSVYKFNELTTDYMKDMFERVADVSVRSIALVPPNYQYLPNRELCVSRRALQDSGTTGYNSLDTIIQSSQTLASFKHNTFKHFM